MTFPFSRFRSLGLVLATGFTALLITGCASTETDATERVLTEAGFVPRKPETPAQQQTYASLKDFEMNEATIQGRTVYAYKNSQKGVVYIGGDAEMSALDRLRKHEAIGHSQSPIVYDSWQPRRKVRR